MSTSIKAVAYYRMSTDRQEASIPDQRAWAVRACKEHRIDLVREFDDPGIPGSEIEQRPGFMALLGFCERLAEQGEPLQAVVCWDGDRLSRADSIRTAACISRLMEAGVSRMLTSNGWVDWNNDFDRVLYNLKQDLSNAGYSKSMSKNVTRAMIAAAQRGEWLGSLPPFAYVKGLDRRLALGDPAQIELVKRIFRDYAETHATAAEIAQALNNEQIPAPGGPRYHKACRVAAANGEPPPPPVRWTRNAVLAILANRRYLGEARWGETHRGKYHAAIGGEARSEPAIAVRQGAKRRRKLKHLPAVRADEQDIIIVPGAHPAIIDPETFDRAAKKRAIHVRYRASPHAGGGEWVLTGRLRCGRCGEPMWGINYYQKQKGKVYRYRRLQCSGSRRRGSKFCSLNAVTQERVVRSVLALLRDQVARPEALKELRVKVRRLADGRQKALGKERARLKAHVEELDRNIARGTKNLALVPEDMVAGVVAQVRAWQTEKEQVLRDQSGLEEAARLEQPAERVEEALALLEELDVVVQESPPAVVRRALAGLVNQATLHFRKEGKGRNSTRFDSLDVELTPAFAALLGVSSVNDGLGVQAGRSGSRRGSSRREKG